MSSEPESDPRPEIDEQRETSDVGEQDDVSERDDGSEEDDRGEQDDVSEEDGGSEQDFDSEQDDASEQTDASEQSEGEDPLQDLIACAPEPAIREAFTWICKRHSSQEVIRLLSSAIERWTDVEATALGQGKRKRVQTCVGCGEDYNEADNIEGSCTHFRWHPEEAEEDSSNDAWADDMSEIDVSPEEFPQGYKFPCCGCDGASPGCTSFKHIASPGERAFKALRA